MIIEDFSIPEIKFPIINNYKILDIDEPIVSLFDYGFKISSQYYKQGISGSYFDCYVRESVAKKLLEAQNYLPKEFKFLIYDGYRPICIQQKLWNHYRQKIKNENPNINDEELDFKTSFYISKPSYDEFNPSLHNTGGAIDLTLIDENGNELDMGTKFDEFSNKTWTNYFEKYEENKLIKNNRRILYKAMIQAGFTNLPSEWWHYDYGTKFWAYFNNTDALYKGILDIEFKNKLLPPM